MSRVMSMLDEGELELLIAGGEGESSGEKLGPKADGDGGVREGEREGCGGALWELW